ncbi:MAG TPA: hypothetical protein VLX91_10155 [Candidatus Acidoferrales bacterium]|nr:hypothetical protein [Candidatus Acidoferrales bacterium]
MTDEIIAEKLTYKEFHETLNSDFEVILPSEVRIPLKLSGMSERKTSAIQETFSLTLHGSSNIFLPQAAYNFNHPKIGGFEMFIVPVGRDLDGFIYEAVFNRLIKNQ